MKLHLGCGKRYMPGYTHIDLCSYPHIDHVCDVRRLPMIDDCSVDVVYACHVIEYFDQFENEAKTVLEEWRRVLKPDGIVRLAVPDFAALCEVYRKYENLGKIIGPLYGRWYVGNRIEFHKYVYDRESLTRLMLLAGFCNVRQWDWRNVFVGELAGYDDYSRAYVPHMDFEDGIHISLNLEANR